MRICVVEDNVEQAQLIATWLESSQHDAIIFNSGKEFINGARQDSFDLVILDWMLPDLDGDYLLRWIREQTDWPVPVLFTTARDSEDDIVFALQSGADDYMIKPLKRAEMVARISALSRRSQWTSQESDQLSFHPFDVNINQRTIARNGEHIALTEREFELAVFLFRNQGRILSRSHILEMVWGQTADLNTRTVDTHVSRLRNKLGLNEDNGWTLRSIYQHGYRLQRIEVVEEAS